MMANPEHLAILKQGVKVWNEWREKNPEIEPDLIRAQILQSDFGEEGLTGIDLHGANISGGIFYKIDLTAANFTRALLYHTDFRVANASGANLTEADLSRAHLRESDFVQAIFNKANLTSADLWNTNLSGANLSGVILDEALMNGTFLTDANLDGARLIKVDLHEAHVTNSNFSHVRLGWTVFAGMDLSRAIGLDAVMHEGPSTLGIDTIYRSGGNIPEGFLRGCGVPETFITYARSLTGKAFEFFSCFISHSAKDKRFCERLYADLQAKGVRVWYFPEDAKWGETVWGEIDRSIKVYDKLIVVCSEKSLTSGPVNREIERALNREDKESKGILFSIRIDDYIFDHWEHERKADLVRKVVGDFSGWDKDAAKYDKAFDKLLKGLQSA